MVDVAFVGGGLCSPLVVQSGLLEADGSSCVFDLGGSVESFGKAVLSVTRSLMLAGKRSVGDGCRTTRDSREEDISERCVASTILA